MRAGSEHTITQLFGNRTNLRPEQRKRGERHHHKRRTTTHICGNAHRTCSQTRQRQRSARIHLVILASVGRGRTFGPQPQPQAQRAQQQRRCDRHRIEIRPIPQIRSVRRQQHKHAQHADRSHRNMRTHTLDHTNRQQAREHQKTKHQQRHRSARRHHQTTINPQRRYRTIRHKQQQRRHHTKIRIPTSIEKRIIPIHRTHAIGKQLLPGRHIIRIIRITQPLGHIQIKPHMTIKQRPSHMIILIVIIRIHAIRMKAQRHGIHQLPHHHRSSHQPRNRQQHAQRHPLTHTRRIQRHLPQARTRAPQRHQHHRQHQQHHAQRTHRKRHTHIRAHRLKRNQRPLRLHHLHTHRTTSRSPYIQRTRRIQRHRSKLARPTISVRTHAHRTHHALTLLLSPL